MPPWDPAGAGDAPPETVVVDTVFEHPRRSDRTARGRRRVRVWHDPRAPGAMFARFDRGIGPNGQYTSRFRIWSELPADKVLAWLSVWRHKKRLTDIQYAEAVSAVGEAAATLAYRRGAKKHDKEVRHN